MGTTQKKIGIFVLAIVLTVVFVSIFSNFVPFHMDEFSLYHRIICDHYPNNSLNTFRVGCDKYGLFLPFSDRILPLREYEYMGSVTSLYYYPLFLIWQSPLSSRFIGLVFLFIEAWLIAKIFGRKFWPIFAGLAIFFPFFFQHAIDTGVIGFQITCLLGIYLCLKKFFEKNKTSFAIGASVLAFLGLWSKLTFIWVLLGLSLVGLMFIWERRSEFKNPISRKRIIIPLVISALIFLILSGTLFFSTDVNNSYYFKQIFSGSGRGLVSTLKLFHPKIIANSDLLKSFVNPFATTQKVFDIFNFVWLSIIYVVGVYLVVPITITALLIKRKREALLNENFQRSIWLCLIFAIVMTFMYVTPSARLMHHAVLALPFLILSFGYLLEYFHPKKFILGWFTFFIILNLVLFGIFSHQPVRKVNDLSLKNINRILHDEHLGNEYFYVAVDWGIYYFQGLYGPKNQSVLYIEPLNTKEQIEILKKMSNEHNRKLLFIMMSDPKFVITIPEERSDINFIKKELGLIECQQVPSDSFWTIWLEPTTAPNICLK